jgi:hypothetical protein
VQLEQARWTGGRPVEEYADEQRYAVEFQTIGRDNKLLSIPVVG